MEIRAQIEKGVYQKDVAWELGVHPKTVGRALKRGGPPPESGPGAKVSVLEPFKSAVDKLLREGVWNAVVIHKQIGLQGYLGGITILRDYVRPMRPMRESRATVRFETAPGEQLQSDWGEHEVLLAGQQRKVHFIVNTLGYSRRFHFWCTERNDAEHTYEGLARSFEYFGGVTREVLVDNQKAAVITHRIGERVRFNERFLDFAGHYGFTPRACRPYRARTKGKDERMVGYVKGNFFLQYREFESMSHLNELAGKWLDEVADKRFHGTVKEVVSDRFARELPHLYPLPTVRFDTSYLEHRFVSWDGYVEVRGNRYSVPANLCGSMVTIRIGLEGNLRVYADEVLVAEHTLRRAAEGWVSIPSQPAALWQRALQVERRDLACYEEVIQWN